MLKARAVASGRARLRRLPAIPAGRLGVGGSAAAIPAGRLGVGGSPRRRAGPAQGPHGYASGLTRLGLAVLAGPGGHGTMISCGRGGRAGRAGGQLEVLVRLTLSQATSSTAFDRPAAAAASVIDLNFPELALSHLETWYPGLCT